MKSSTLCPGQRLTVMPSLWAFSTICLLVPSILQPNVLMPVSFAMAMVSSLIGLLMMSNNSASG